MGNGGVATDGIVAIVVVVVVAVGGEGGLDGGRVVAEGKKETSRAVGLTVFTLRKWRNLSMILLPGPSVATSRILRNCHMLFDVCLCKYSQTCTSSFATLAADKRWQERAREFFKALLRATRCSAVSIEPGASH